jgi:N-acetylglucosamine malate deacetylase 1
MLDIYSKKRVLVLAPHPDDAEFSSGGTLSMLKENDSEIFVAVFSMCEKSVPAGYPEDAIERELENSMDLLGVDDDHLIKFRYEVREFPKYRQEILEDMVKLNRMIKPDLVFLPSGKDLHQDHTTINQEGVRAFKFCNILGYEMPWNNFSFLSSIYVVLNQRHIDRKIELIEQYQTQKFRNYSGEDFVLSLSKLRGIQINEQYAESFELIRWIARENT